MRKYEIPGLILVCAVLLSYVIGLSLWQEVVVTAFVGAAYWSAKTIEGGKVIKNE